MKETTAGTDIRTDQDQRNRSMSNSSVKNIQLSMKVGQLGNKGLKIHRLKDIQFFFKKNNQIKTNSNKDNNMSTQDLKIEKW